MNSYLKLTLAIPDLLQEIFITQFDEMAFTGFEQRDHDMDAYILSSNFSDVDREEIQNWLAAQEGDLGISSEEIIEDQNWNENWEKSIQPIAVGKFWVTPTWAKNKSDSLIPLFIDPKMAFGTGYHETTRLILRVLPDVVKEGQRVLDVGTGTGILAIGALKLGAKSAVGVDIDEWSYDNAMENAEINGVTTKFIVRSGSLEAIPPQEKVPFDLVLANINRNALMQIAKQLVDQVADGGTLVLSGLLKDDEFGIREIPAYRNLTFISKSSENDWITLTFQK